MCPDQEEECRMAGTQIRVAIMSDLFVNYSKINADGVEAYYIGVESLLVLITPMDTICERVMK